MIRQFVVVALVSKLGFILYANVYKYLKNTSKLKDQGHSDKLHLEIKTDSL